jgi:aminoglycoside phosphotransferase (APT) family kinase protein
MNTNATARADIDFEPAKLSAFLAVALPETAGPLKIERFGGGQSNPTYFIDASASQMVLRKCPPGEHARGAHDVGREYQIISALHATPVPVPAPILYHDEPDFLGTPFYLMSRLEGRVFHDASLSDFPPASRRPFFANWRVCWRHCTRSIQIRSVSAAGAFSRTSDRSLDAAMGALAETDRGCVKTACEVRRYG